MPFTHSTYSSASADKMPASFIPSLCHSWMVHIVANILCQEVAVFNLAASGSSSPAPGALQKLLSPTLFTHGIAVTPIGVRPAFLLSMPTHINQSMSKDPL